MMVRIMHSTRFIFLLLFHDRYREKLRRKVGRLPWLIRHPSIDPGARTNVDASRRIS
jgi:hypothetical protein